MDSFIFRIIICEVNLSIVSWKSRVLGFGHAELNISNADTAKIARLYRGHIPVLWHVMPNYRGLKSL
jgi:formaldehyde-activating enzyme involved in methanogenesis